MQTYSSMRKKFRNQSWTNKLIIDFKNTNKLRVTSLPCSSFTDCHKTVWHVASVLNQWRKTPIDKGNTKQQISKTSDKGTSKGHEWTCILTKNTHRTWKERFRRQGIVPTVQRNPQMRNRNIFEAKTLRQAFNKMRSSFREWERRFREM